MEATTLRAWKPGTDLPYVVRVGAEGILAILLPAAWLKKGRAGEPLLLPPAVRALDRLRAMFKSEAAITPGRPRQSPGGVGADPGRVRPKARRVKNGRQPLGARAHAAGRVRDARGSQTATAGTARGRTNRWAKAVASSLLLHEAGNEAVEVALRLEVASSDRPRPRVLVL